MKIKIRRGVFETNSSSQHSLVIKKTSEMSTKKEMMENIYVWKDGTLHISDDMLEFGRAPFRMLRTPIDKLMYLVAGCNGDVDRINALVELFQEQIPEISEIKFPVAWGHDDEIDYGYIDHQSQGLVDFYLKESGVSEKDFIFDKKYIVIIDGDEYCEWENIKASGLVNEDEIEKELNPWNARTTDDDYDESEE